MLHATPFAAIDELQIMEPLVQGIAEWTIEIAIEGVGKRHALAQIIHEYRHGVRSSRPAGLFSFGLLDGLHVRLRRPYLREAPAGFGLERLATAFMNNPG